VENLDLNFSETQRSAETVVSLATGLWALGFLVAVVVAVWMYRDAQRRGKSGFAAALIAFLSASYGIPLTLIVLGTWILFRPEKTQLFGSGSENDLPSELPSGIVAGPSPSEFLERLEDEVSVSSGEGTS